MDEPITEDQILEAVTEAIDELIAAGLIEVDGIDDDGDWLYAPTPLGSALSKAIEGLAQ